MRYTIYLVAAIAFELLARLLTPILPLFAVKRGGWCDNGNRWLVEPRLPVWLAWFDTPDNSLWGDTGWREKHCPKYWNTYLGMALWLWRNSATGFARSVLALRVVAKDVIYIGPLDISPDRPGVFGHFWASDGRAWQHKCAFQFLGKNIGLNFGWQIDPLLESGKIAELCHFKMSVKFK